MKRLAFNVSGMVLTTLVSKQLFGPGILQTLQAAKGNSAAAVVIVAWVYYGKRPCTAHVLQWYAVTRPAAWPDSSQLMQVALFAAMTAGWLQPLLPHRCKLCLPAVWRTLDTVNEWFEDKVVGSKS